VNKIKLVFSLYVLSFVFLAFGIFFEFFHGKIFFLPIILSFLLGIFLLYLTIKEKIKGKLRIYLILSSSSIFVFFISMILHNFFYALTVISENIIILKYLFEALHVVFFVVSIIIAPVLFIIGVIGSIYYFINS